MSANTNEANIVGRDLIVEVDVGIYSVTAVQKTAYWFTDRCFVFIERIEGDRLKIRIQAKSEEVSLPTIKDDFCNALLDQSLRERVSKETEPLRNLILAHALSKTNLIDPQLDEAEPEMDLAGISNPDPLPSDEAA
jgi:His-Xaa-Ser system protein HxsD